MSYDLQRRNDALRLNPNTFDGEFADIHQTVRGSSFYFAICAVMGFTGLAVLGASYMKPRTDRIFFYITAAINITACIAYFTMGSNLGWAPTSVEFVRSDPVVAGQIRQVFYARYVDWVVTTPLLLMDLLLTAALPWPTVIWVIFLDEVMIITGLIGALVPSRYKFGFFTIGCVAMFGVFYELAIVGRKHARALGSDVNRCFTTCGVLTLFLWTLYPIAWGLAEGGNVISPDSEAVFYGVLDFCAKPIFSAALIYGHWNISPARLGLRIREFGEPFDTHANNEKSAQRDAGDHIGRQHGHSGDGNASPNTIAGTAPAAGNISNQAAPSGHDHAAHTTGYTPYHESLTTESGRHTATV